jgi:hypothetical protein
VIRHFSISGCGKRFAIRRNLSRCFPAFAKAKKIPGQDVVHWPGVIRLACSQEAAQPYARQNQTATRK